ncbi:dephospho-CoA kinase [Microbacterium amylolyticum]|uniref:Dephospho-CoA kinase n=1 Tax=Microbacterium amylolyticum TaxID=936337 RepID=A0ABS4ZKL0_9MICO|nr:dephospho-CoA kinase [Microbacterium amylolyticum]MBP2437831.1 dephospho-CoA kinase [Microbacterium amylolyticum]
MVLVAVTGGIASGKSTISRRLASHGAVVVDADQVVRDLQQPGQAVFASIVETFGPGVVGDDGALDRGALGAIVFADNGSLAQLNRIVHPAVRDETQRRFREAFVNDPRAVVVYDVPLLAEARGTGEWDVVVVAHAPAPVRIERMIAERGMTREEAVARIANQVGDEERLALADVVIDTAGTMARTLAQADALWSDLRARS